MTAELPQPIPVTVDHIGLGVQYVNESGVRFAARIVGLSEQGEALLKLSFPGATEDEYIGARPSSRKILPGHWTLVCP